MDITVLIFAKYPRPGHVKTRLVPPLSFDQAARLHRRALEATTELARALAGARVILVVTPDETAGSLADELPKPVDAWWSQGNGSLGERLERATRRAFDEAAGAVILLGADSPTLPATRLVEAIEGLGRSDAVLGPSDDGGYYLLALRADRPELFAGIDWGTARVAAQTRQCARANGVHLVELGAWHDIDRPEDLVTALASLEHCDVDAPLRSAFRRELCALVQSITGSDGRHE